MTVSVTVVRPCSVETPAAPVPSLGAQSAQLTIRCGKAASTSSLKSIPGIVPVAGAAVRTAAGEKGTLLSIDF